MVVQPEKASKIVIGTIELKFAEKLLLISTTHLRTMIQFSSPNRSQTRHTTTTVRAVNRILKKKIYLSLN